MDNDEDVWVEYYVYYIEESNYKRFVVDTIQGINNINIKLVVERWIKVLLKDLNKYTEDLEYQEMRIRFFCEKVSYLLNYYHVVEKSTAIIKDDLSLYNIYKEWYSKNESKVSIKDNLRELKDIHPELKLVALQEFPVDKEEVQILCFELESIGKVFLNPEPFVIDKKPCATQGAILVYY